MIRQILVVLFALLACCGAPAGFASDPSEANTWERFAGEWTPTPESNADVIRAVERVTDQMSFLPAHIARSRLVARCLPPPALRMRRRADAFVIEFVGMETHVMPLSGASSSQDGRKLSVQIEQDVLVHRGETSEGTRVNRFRVDSSGGVLTMETVVSNPRLPEPVRFSVRFVRTGNRSDARR